MYFLSRESSSKCWQHQYYGFNYYQCPQIVLRLSTVKFYFQTTHQIYMARSFRHRICEFYFCILAEVKTSTPQYHWVLNANIYIWCILWAYNIIEMIQLECTLYNLPGCQFSKNSEAIIGAYFDSYSITKTLHLTNFFVLR